jgi:hypothetical protein
VADFVVAYTLDWANEVKLLDDMPHLKAHGMDVLSPEGPAEDCGGVRQPSFLILPRFARTSAPTNRPGSLTKIANHRDVRKLERAPGRCSSGGTDGLSLPACRPVATGVIWTPFDGAAFEWGGSPEQRRRMPMVSTPFQRTSLRVEFDLSTALLVLMMRRSS